VLDKGQLWEYTNWKRSSELHNDSIHLNAATVREAQNSDRRFCFELVTPVRILLMFDADSQKFKRVYQAMSNEDMESWIQAIRNAIESALDGSAAALDLMAAKSPPQNIKRHPIGDMFSSKGGKGRRTSSGSQETRELLTGGSEKTISTTKTPPNILATIRNVDPSNLTCADCGNTSKTEWCSINLAVVLCIGIPRCLLTG
jgi:Arf-GAP with SH3 domain, ANK repeat and PH domain-containing protein